MIKCGCFVLPFQYIFLFFASHQGLNFSLPPLSLSFTLLCLHLCFYLQNYFSLSPPMITLFFLFSPSAAIIEGGFPTHLPLQHMQKDLRLGMLMGDTLELPLPLTAATNEVFKHAKRLGYGEHDVSSVYIRTRF